VVCLSVENFSLALKGVGSIMSLKQKGLSLSARDLNREKDVDGPTWRERVRAATISTPVSIKALGSLPRHVSHYHLGFLRPPAHLVINISPLTMIHPRSPFSTLSVKYIPPAFRKET
jgi:hypothetical protein